MVHRGVWCACLRCVVVCCCVLDGCLWASALCGLFLACGDSNAVSSSGTIKEQLISDENNSFTPLNLSGSSTENLGRGQREKRPPSWMRHYVTNTFTTENKDPTSSSSVAPSQSHSLGKPFL